MKNGVAGRPPASVSLRLRSQNDMGNIREVPQEGFCNEGDGYKERPDRKFLRARAEPHRVSPRKTSPQVYSSQLPTVLRCSNREDKCDQRPSERSNISPAVWAYGKDVGKD